jgi:hypothetical protein
MLYNNIKIYIIFIVIAVSLFCFSGCKVVELDDPGSLTIEDLIQVTPESTTVNANGVDRVKITATLKGDTPDGKKIIFKTDCGTFASIPEGAATSNNQQQIEINAVGKKAEVSIISSTDVKKVVTVSASVEGFTAFTSVEFVRVFPARIFLTSNVTLLKANGQDTATITATLVPPDNIGTVSKGARVIFDAIDKETGVVVSQLHREALSDSNGKASANFTSQQPGLMEITCSIEGQSEKSDPLLIEFYEEEEEDS